MPLIRFTKLIPKVLNHQKKQTIRLPRIRPIKKGDTLHVYVMIKLGTAIVTDINRKPLIHITDSEMIADGFDDPSYGKIALAAMHKLESVETEFDIIKYEPEWPKYEMVVKEED